MYTLIMFLRLRLGEIMHMNIVVILVLMATSANALKFTMELSSSGPLLARMISSGNYTQFLESKNRRRFDLRALNEQDLSDYFDEYYIGAVSIGKPPQTLYLSMDTGSSNVWVIDSSCSQKQCTGYASSHRPKIKFSPSASKTFKKIPQGFSMKYNTGSASGYYGKDIVRFAGLQVEEQKFGVATAVADIFGYQPIDGIFGLGWPSLATDKVKTPLEAILPDLDEKSFTVWMGRRTTTSYGQNAGSIVFGARDMTHCNNATQWVPLSKKAYWQFQIKQFQIGQYIWKSTDEVITDSGTSFIGTPMAVLDGVIRMTGAKYDRAHEVYVVPCTTMSKQPNLIFTINTKKYVIPSAQYVLDLKFQNGYCALAFFGIKAGGFSTSWILGNPWTRTFCHTHDFENERIGLSVAKPV
ncbi:hypothetical protein Y032_0195g1493 [Ancylostoma ceylanicum]|uniref:Peptidase A1 domain-containing protein n=1 Tax=Ancylostoma ceylanicum TaxID=53326 RepID=A0A016SPM9_9BILA|nr:hypothetical protein Y032_0195g1493 [Ancylostoma ceylanicum]